MTKTSLITLIISVLGGAIGTAGLTLSILNYFRDRPMVKVTLHWDWSVTPEGMYDPKKPWGVISVANVGRRPVYIVGAALKYHATFYERILSRLFNRHPKNSFLVLIKASIEGKKLSEGDPPQTFLVAQDKMEQHRLYWAGVRAVVDDSAGRRYLSPPVDRCPSWAGGLQWGGAREDEPD